LSGHLLYLTNIDADVQDGDLFSKYLSVSSSVLDNISIPLGKDEVKTGYGYTYPNEIDLRIGTGTISVRVHVTTTSSDVTCRVRATRTDKDGVAISSTDWTGTQILSASRTFTTPAVDWTAANADDRLRIEYQFTTTSNMAATPSVRLGGTLPWVEAPFTTELDISVHEAGGGTIIPSPGVYNYIEAGREIEATATPEDISKVFQKWVINAVDVYENPTILIMNNDIVAVAHFQDAVPYNVIISVEQGLGSAIPEEGVHEYIAGVTVTVLGEPLERMDNVKFIVDSNIVFDNEEYFKQAQFIMPSEDVTVKIYFTSPFIELERSEDQLSWVHIADIYCINPENPDPGIYLDWEIPKAGDVTYYYRGRRFERNIESEYSNIESILFVKKIVSYIIYKDHQSIEIESVLYTMFEQEVIDVHIEWKQTTAQEWTSTASQPMTEIGTFTNEILGLNFDTEYEYRPVVIWDNNGTPEIIYGATLAFLTLMEPPILLGQKIGEVFRLSWEVT